MMTRDLLRAEMAISEAKEEETYKTLTLSLFRELQEPLKVLYDQTVTATNCFASITGDAWTSPRMVDTQLRV